MTKKRKLVKVKLHKEKIGRNTYLFTSSKGKVVAISKAGKEKGKIRWVIGYGREGKGIKKFKTIYTPSHYTYKHVLKYHYYR